jgi:MFS family permease
MKVLHCCETILTGAPIRYAIGVFTSTTMTAAPTRPARIYYGWAVLVVAAAAMVGTLPGRTQGLGLITEPLIADLGLDRVTYAQLNFWATILGAGFAVGIGRVLDRFGGRIVLTVVAAALGLVVCAMAGARSVAQLALWVTLTRGLGQSALSVISIAIVGHWFTNGTRRIDTAMAVYSVVLSVGFMAAFPLVGWLVQIWGWRAAWFAVGCALIAGLAPLSWLVVRRAPGVTRLRRDAATARQGHESDGGQTGVTRLRRDAAVAWQGHGSDPSLTPDDGHTWGEAVSTPAFWVFALGTALYGLVASGIGLFNESILAERGFGARVYYQTLGVTAITALAGNFLGGWLAGRVSLTKLLSVSLFILALGLVALPHVTTLLHVMVWAGTMGIGGGIVMVLFFSVWPRVYGRRHLGRIQGSAQALTVLASAVGPLLLAWCVAWTGSYQGMFRVLAATIGTMAIAALRVPLPRPTAQRETHYPV